LPQHVFDLKRIILQSADLQRLDESEDIESIKQVISRSLSPSRDAELPLDNNFLNRLRAKCLSEKIALSVWLRQEVLGLADHDTEPPQHSETPTHPLGYSFTSQVFFVARDILESIDDIAILADVIGICLISSGMEAMASLINTLHFHYRCFAAIGALRPLLKKFIERYQSLRYDSSSLEKPYLQALADICSIAGVDEGVQQQLNYDISRCDQRNNIAMCSPASDNAADMFTSSSMDSDDEIDRILSSGTTMDEQSMARMFKRLTLRLEKQTLAKSSRCGQWFSHLRSFDDSAFDGLIRDWLSSSTFTSNPTHYRLVLPALIGSECLTLTTFVQIVDDCVQMLGADDHSAKIILGLGLLEAILPVASSGSTATIPVGNISDLV
jgi:mediator of RNA polymerase II transcription subunit 12